MSDLPYSPAPWDKPEVDVKQNDVKDVKDSDPRLSVEPAEQQPPPNILIYKLGLLEGAVEVAICTLEQSDEDVIAEGLSAVLKRVKAPDLKVP